MIFLSNLGLKNINTVSHHSPLTELGMDSMMAVEIRQTLEREFNTFFSAEDVRKLNFFKLMELFNDDSQDEKDSSKVVHDGTDFAAIKLLVRLTADENMVSDVCVDFPAKWTGAKSEVYLLPGMEGCGNVFYPLVPKIEASVTCLQHGTYNVGATCTSINDIADCLLQV